MVPGELIYTIGDAHVYSNHYDQVEEQLTRTNIAASPSLTLEAHDYKYPWLFESSEIVLHNYNPLSSIKAEVAV